MEWQPAFRRPRLHRLAVLRRSVDVLSLTPLFISLLAHGQQLPSRVSGAPDGRTRPEVRLATDDSLGALLCFVPDGDLPVLIAGAMSLDSETEVDALTAGGNLSRAPTDPTADDRPGLLPGQGGDRYRCLLERLDTARAARANHGGMTITHLPPGAYRVLVKARNDAGEWSDTPASFSFVVKTPLWARWWFITSLLVVLVAVALVLHNLRVRRIVELEQVRARIAADLHDDIGSTLSSISVFSKLAEEETQQNAPGTAQIVRRIGTSAQATLESLDEIVWLVKPGNDSVESIVVRIREYATQLCEAAGIRFVMQSPCHLNHLRMTLEDRRQLYLIAKEAIHNVVKHSACSAATMVLEVRGRELSLRIQDNGKGFVPERPGDGDGLDNMQRRASAMRGRLRLDSLPGTGTTVHLHAKLI
jgi:signal transduction histidine kinase